MAIIRKILSWLPCQTIHNNGDPYLRRFTLLWTPLFRVYLHEILRSDGDRALHDHPWAFVSFILRGGYVEHLPGGPRWCGPGRLIFHRAFDLHRVQLRGLPDGTECAAWTLVFCGRKKRQWGFLTKDGWISHDKY